MSRITRRTGHPPAIALTPEEAFVLSRIDGDTSLVMLENLAVVEPARLHAILARLSEALLIEIEPESELPFGVLGVNFLDLGEGPQLPSEPSNLQVGDIAAKVSARGAEGDDAAELTESEAELEPVDVRAETTYRERYGTKIANLTTDQRLKFLQTALSQDLCALAFDPNPAVVVALLESPNASVSIARLVARHHRTTTGLEGISRRAEYVRDAHVSRALLRNAHTSEQLLRSLIAHKPLRLVYQIAIDREVPELTRTRSKAVLRSRFSQVAPEERADLLVRTEGRALALLAGCTFDPKMTTILCSRTFASAMFVQSLARFSGCPPALLSHLLKQPFVKRAPHLRTLLLAHPNVPGDAKRNR